MNKNNNNHNNNIPIHLYYSPDHEWLSAEGQEAVIGITAFAAGELGDIVYIDIPFTGRPMRKGEVFGTIEAVKTVSDLFMPVSGTITMVNPKILAKPETVNNDPYGEGWLVRIELTRQGELGELLTADDYLQLTGK